MNSTATRCGMMENQVAGAPFDFFYLFRMSFWFWGVLNEMSGFSRFVPLTCFPWFSFFLFGVLDGDGVHNQGDDDSCDAPSGGYTDGKLNTHLFSTNYYVLTNRIPD